MKKNYLIFGGIAAALVILYLLFKGSSATPAANTAYATEPSSGSSLNSIFATLGLTSGITNATSSLGEAIDSFGDLNSPGIGSGSIGYSNQPGLVTPSPISTALPTSFQDYNLNSPGLLATPSLGSTVTNPFDAGGDDFSLD